MTVEILLRPDLGKKAYRMRCRFTIDSYPKDEWLEKVKYEVARRFVEDMAKQGYDYIDKFGFKLSGPLDHVAVSHFIPPYNRQEKWHYAARDGMPMRVSGDSYASDLPSLAEAEKWDFELSAVFVSRTLVVEVEDKPDADCS